MPEGGRVRTEHEGGEGVLRAGRGHARGMAQVSNVPHGALQLSLPRIAALFYGSMQHDRSPPEQHC